ncbi:hypothetical protein DPX16_19846 [Anabarilius grahami]|uniref:Uncharacterized protein n=1 Tax=Anabarilius grahami TaxID=495550 RepID=A0A3N0Y766_ANAGA|nr:hypothetical protein DPX16_19846 [Anabarilius grahami]
MEGGIHCTGTSPRKACAQINQSESMSTPINLLRNLLRSGYGSSRQRCTGLARERFVDAAQFNAGSADPLKLKDGEVPVIKDPGHVLEPQALISYRDMNANGRQH